MAARGGSAFGLKGDVSKAHRRFKLLRRDWGLVACSLMKGQTWLNRVGTFGVTSSNYWFSRLIGGPSRFLMYLLGRSVLWQLLYSDDYKGVASGPDSLVTILLCRFVLDLLGVPISYEKVQGVFELDWVGHALDSLHFAVGISEARSKWLVECLAALLVDGMKVSIRVFLGVLGRVGFAAGPLERVRPFLAA